MLELRSMLGVRRDLQPAPHQQSECPSGYHRLDTTTKCKPEPPPPPRPPKPGECSPIGSVCWINAQCCSARCTGIHTCGQALGGRRRQPHRNQHRHVHHEAVSAGKLKRRNGTAHLERVRKALKNRAERNRPPASSPAQASSTSRTKPVTLDASLPPKTTSSPPSVLLVPPSKSSLYGFGADHAGPPSHRALILGSGSVSLDMINHTSLHDLGSLALQDSNVTEDRDAYGDQARLKDRSDILEHHENASAEHTRNALAEESRARGGKIRTREAGMK